MTRSCIRVVKYWWSLLLFMAHSCFRRAVSCWVVEGMSTGSTVPQMTTKQASRAVICSAVDVHAVCRSWHTLVKSSDWRMAAGSWESAQYT